LATDVEAETRELHARSDDVFDEQLGVGRLDPEFRRQVRFRGGIAERKPHQQLDVGWLAANFCASQTFSTTNVRMSAAYATSMSTGFLMGLVWMHRSIGRPSCCRRPTSALVATSNPPPQIAIVDNTMGCGNALTA
jgi:hypothetical protein